MAADRGLFYAEQAGLMPHYILGDFDSLPKGILDKYLDKDIKIRTYPPEKDYTDTHLALLWAVEEGAEMVTIVGGMGSRFDHSFANIGLLSMLLEQGVKGEILDPHNRIFMMDKEHSGDVRIQKQKDCEEYISLIPYTEKVTGITLKGFKYPLEKETLRIGISRGISNELEEEEGLISIEEGILIVCISKD
jgi:thiamine pyrophosphokinase